MKYLIKVSGDAGYHNEEYEEFIIDNASSLIKLHKKNLLFP